jgi:hypothetical protein
MVDERLIDVRTWDDLKTALGITAATLRKLQANDPHTFAPIQSNKPLTGQLVWNDAGVVTTDARSLWDLLSQDTADASDAPTDSDASPAVADKPTTGR